MNQSVEWREWDLTGLLVTQLRFDYQVHVHMWTFERDLYLQIGSPFTFQTAEGVVWECDGETSRNLCSLLALRFRSVTQFRSSSDGVCQLIFADDAMLTCMPDPQYEAWESHGSGDLASASLFCSPGGGSPWG